MERKEIELQDVWKAKSRKKCAGDKMLRAAFKMHLYSIFRNLSLKATFRLAKCVQGWKKN